jgi:hypothetical protein
MTALVIPPFERRLLETVRERVAAEPVRQWPPRSLELCLDVLRRIRAGAADTRQTLEEVLAEGVEARSFARDYGPFLAPAEDQLAFVRELVESLSLMEDAASQSLLAEVRLLEQEGKAFRDLLAEALARASEPPRPINWERVRAAEEAHARGETKPFSRR